MILISIIISSLVVVLLLFIVPSAQSRYAIINRILISEFPSYFPDFPRTDAFPSKNHSSTSGKQSVAHSSVFPFLSSLLSPLFPRLLNARWVTCSVVVGIKQPGPNSQYEPRRRVVNIFPLLLFPAGQTQASLGTGQSLELLWDFGFSDPCAAVVSGSGAAIGGCFLFVFSGRIVWLADRLPSICTSD